MSSWGAGTNGRRRDALTPDDLALYDAVAATLDPAPRCWLEGGRRGAGDPSGAPAATGRV
jgi:hypothetical protein